MDPLQMHQIPGKVAEVKRQETKDLVQYLMPHQQSLHPHGIGVVQHLAMVELR